MSRAYRKRKRSNLLKISHKPELFEVFDNCLMATYALNEDEYNYIVSKLNFTEIEQITDINSWSDAKKALNIIDNLIDEFYYNQDNTFKQSEKKKK